MKHYRAILVPTLDGAWRAHFADFPGCRAEAASEERFLLQVLPQLRLDDRSKRKAASCLLLTTWRTSITI